MKIGRNNLISAIDIGSSSIKGLVVALNSESKELDAIASVKIPSFGVRRGVVVRPESVSQDVARAVQALQERSGEKIDDILVSINGSHLFTMSSWGSVVVSRADQRISQEDVNRVIQAAQTFSLPSNKEILDVYPKEFVVDGERGIKEFPLGMRGLKLEAEILAIGAFSPYFKNSTNAVLEAGLQISDIIPCPLASARAVLDDRLKELGVCVIDMGAGTTGLAVYKEGDLIHTAVLPIGSSHITNDIAIGLKTDMDTAERIKKEFGTCVASGSRKEKIEIPDEDSPLVFSSKVLSEIIVARVSEIFSEIQKDLKNNLSGELLPGGIILTGGGSKLARVVDLCKKELKLPCRIGLPRHIKGIEKDHALSVACGLALFGKDFQSQDNSEFWQLGKGIGRKIKNFFSMFIP